MFLLSSLITSGATSQIWEIKNLFKKIKLKLFKKKPLFMMLKKTMKRITFLPI